MRGAVIKNILSFSVKCLAGFLAFCTAVNLYMYVTTKDYIYDDVSQVPGRYTAIVPGAKVIGVNTVSHVFRDRIEAGVALYNAGKVQKILVSGDHGKQYYDEVNAAKTYINKMHHISKDDVFMDHAGFSTYETMYRAKEIFEVTDAVITTQDFHLIRSVYIARSLGIDAAGYASPEIDRFTTKTHASWAVREFFARVKDFFFTLFKPDPTYLGEVIPITASGTATWD